MEQLYQIRWQDIVDILVLSLIFYRLILMLQGTKASQIVLGLVLIVLAYYFAKVFQLYGISWLLTNLINSFVLLIVILFQADFRNALARVGQTKLLAELTTQTPSEHQGVLGEVIRATEYFSNAKIGCIIVFANQTGLKNYAEKGVLLHAHLSSSLLVSIFQTRSPLHDGAVLVQKNGRILAAGCILPLSTELGLSTVHGTRHRAALGLSEETDAVVLVVSEERGNVSLAIQGKLHNIKLENLRAQLSENWVH